MKRVIIILSITLIALLVSFVANAKAQSIEYMGSTLWTGARDVEIVGDYAYCAFRNGLVIVNVSNPASPSFMTRLFCRGSGEGIYISGIFAYMANGYHGLQIIDITNPTNPTLLGSYDTPGFAYDVFVDGNNAYVADYGSGLQVIDIANPANPILAGSCDTPYRACGVFVDGTYVYVADGNSGLQIIDITNPTNPTLLGSHDTPGYAYNVFVDGNNAYVADYGSGLQVIDIANPANPTQAGSCETPGSATDIMVANNYAYVADYVGLQIINISDPSNPTLAGDYHTPRHSWGVFFAGSYAYMADDHSGLQIINVSNPDSPTYAGSYNTLFYIRGVFVTGDYAYVADASYGLHVISISNPTNPILEGGYDSPSGDDGVFVNGNYAYMAGVNYGLQIIDITDPVNPILSGSCDTPGYAYNVFVSGNYAYIADCHYGLQVINVANPETPTLVGNCETPSWANDVFVVGNYAYIAGTSGGLLSINISIPEDPILVGSCNTPGCAWSVFVEGNYAYVADGDSGLQVIDITNPANPIWVGGYDTSFDSWGDAKGVFVTDNYVYLADRGTGLHVIDISNPTSPTLITNYNTPGAAYRVFVANNYAYLADDYSFMILRFAWEEPSDCYLSGIIFSNNQFNAISDQLDIVATFENQSSNSANNIAISAYIDGDPIPLSLGERDLDGDSKIDAIEPGWDTLLIASYQLPTNSWENHELELIVTEIDGQSVNQNIIKNISCYFAQKIENSSPDPFDLREDAYSFPNPPTKFSDLGELLFSYCSLFPTELVNYIYGLIGGRNGRCYGMASTCYWYFQEPSRKPQPGEVFEWDLGYEGVLNNINDYFLNQVLDESPESYQPPNQVEPECRNYLTAGRPVVIQMGGGTTSHPVFHAVNAYRIIADETGDSTYLFIYENNFPSEVGDPESRNVVIGLIDVQQNEYKYPLTTLGEGENALQAGYYSRLVASSPPNTIMSGCDMVRDAFDFLQRTISEFWDFGKSILNIRCPVRGYVENEFGQRSGYLSEDEFVNEIPNAEVLSIFNDIGDSLLAFYLPLDGQYTLHLFSLEEGVSNISLIYPNSDSSGTLASLENIPFSQQSLATFYFDPDGFGDLEMDIEGDGTPDFNYAPVDNIPPAFFKLLYPLEVNLDQDTIQFVWSRSFDLDFVDSIFYRFYLSDDTLFIGADSVDIVNDTTFLWTNNLSSGYKYWRVKAIDARGLETLCLNGFGKFSIRINYPYLPGDVNMALGIWPPTVIGGDVTYLVGYFIGGGQAACLLDGFWCSADINGDCVIIGGDVTALVGYFVAGGALVPCPDYEPAWPPVPDDQPLGWPNCETPVINSRVIPTGQGK